MFCKAMYIGMSKTVVCPAALIMPCRLSAGAMNRLQAVWSFADLHHSHYVTSVPGHQLDRSTINYEVPGSETTKIMGVFLALGSIAFAFGDTNLPEIQVSHQIKSASLLSI